jgi:hypothetical protein
MARLNYRLQLSPKCPPSLISGLYPRTHVISFAPLSKTNNFFFACRYSQSASFGVVATGFAQLQHVGGSIVAAPGLEDVILWDTKRGEKVVYERSLSCCSWSLCRVTKQMPCAHL